MKLEWSKCLRKVFFGYRIFVLHSSISRDFNAIQPKILKEMIFYVLLISTSFRFYELVSSVRCLLMAKLRVGNGNGNPETFHSPKFWFASVEKNEIHNYPNRFNFWEHECIRKCACTKWRNTKSDDDKKMLQKCTEVLYYCLISYVDWSLVGKSTSFVVEVWLADANFSYEK